MASTEKLVMDWGGMALATERVKSFVLTLDNGVDASAHADFSSQRLSYLETLHALTHVAAEIVEVFAGVTTEAAFDALNTGAGAPVLVLHMTIADLVNGGNNEYWWSDQVLANVQTLFQKALFTGHIDTWRHNLNRFFLSLSGTERGDNKEIPEKRVTLSTWPASRPADEGKPFPEVWGTPGATIDSDKIADGIGAVPAVLVDRATLKYLVAGHALAKIAGVTSGSVTVWCKIPGFSDGLGYIANCTFDLSDTDDEGTAVTTLTLPTIVLARVFIPTVAEGSYFTNTAASPENAAGRDAATEATVDAGEILQMAVGHSLDRSEAILRVWIAASKADSDLRVRWTGPQSTILSDGAGTINIDSASGWDPTGEVHTVAGGVESYSAITEISATEWQLTVSAHSSGATGNATMVGAWQTLSTSEVEVSDDRDWTQGNFHFFELELENTHGSNSHNIGHLGFRVELEIRGYPEVFVPCDGVAVTFRSVAFGASRNPALIIEDLHTRVLGFAEARIGTTFDAAITLLAGWKFDLSVARPLDSGRLLKDLLRQSKAFTWRDADDVVQIGIFRLDDISDQTIVSTTDMINPKGDDFEVSWTPPEEVKNRIWLKWGPNLFDGGYSHEYHITEDSSRPVDTAREAAAAASQSTFGITGTLVFEAPHVQDADTALELLQFLFDFQSVRRRRLSFTVPRHVVVAAGAFIAVTHPLLAGNENFIIDKLTRRGNRVKIGCLSIALEGQYEDAVGFEVTASTRTTFGWGSPEYWDAWEETGVETTSSVTGRVVDYGLAHFAERFFADTSEKATHGGAGSAGDPLYPSRLKLVSQTGTRVALQAASRSGAVVTWKFAVTNVSGGNQTIRELGIFSASSGNNMLGRIVLASDFTLADDKTMLITLVITTKRPTARSSMTDYGLDLMANRMFEDTAEKPTHLAIGDDNTAENAADVALGNQISTRSAFGTGFPLHSGLSSLFNAGFASGTHGNKTVKEVGIFTHTSDPTAIARKVIDNEVVLGATDGFTGSHRLTAAHFT